MPELSPFACQVDRLTVMYGDNDWMKPTPHGRQTILDAVDRQKNGDKTGPGSTKVVEVPHAGHHLYMDNAPVFHQLVLE